MNNSRIRTSNFSLISKIEAISQEAIHCIHPRRVGRNRDARHAKDNFFVNLLTPSPHLVPVTRWVE